LKKLKTRAGVSVGLAFLGESPILSRLLNFSGFKASSAHGNSLGFSLYYYFDSLQIGHPSSFSQIMGVRHKIAE
jgi:hypothetical protein